MPGFHGRGDAAPGRPPLQLLENEVVLHKDMGPEFSPHLDAKDGNDAPLEEYRHLAVGPGGGQHSRVLGTSLRWVADLRREDLGEADLVDTGAVSADLTGACRCRVPI